MNPIVVANRCLVLVENTKWDELQLEYGKKHLRNMVTEMQTWDLSDIKMREKTMRWLGWLQCAIVIGGGATLEDMKQINREV